MKMGEIMKSSIPISLVIIAISLKALHAQHQLSPADQISSMAWLEGEWSGTFAGGPFWAQYSSPEGGNIISLNKDLSGGQTPGYIEFERFTFDDTSAFLVPYPGGKPHSLKFRLVAAAFDPSSKKATFRNTVNDWPTDLTYARVSADSLVITLSGPGEEGRSPQVLDARLGLVKRR
jgi:hypothetical protein